MSPAKPVLLFTATLLAAMAPAQITPAAPSGPSTPVSFASVSELNLVLTQLDQASQSAMASLRKVRVEKWKTDSSTKKQLQDNVDSLLRNMQSALPGMVSELRTAPENLAFTFKLYRNLSALSDVFNNVAESCGAFGSRDDYQGLANNFTALDRVRRNLAERMDKLSSSKEAELSRLREQLRALQAAAPPTFPKKIIVDDSPSAKKPVKKKAPAKTAAAPPPATPAKPQ